MCALLWDIIRNAGHSRKGAHNRIVGLNLIKADDFDLIFLGLKMPEMNGFELLRMWADGGQLHEKRIIIQARP